MQVFYSKNIVGNNILIENQEHIHLSKVLRKSIGDEVYVCNGMGLLLKASISSISKKATALTVLEEIRKETENSNKLILAVAPTKNMDRYEWMLEKAIEIGVNTIIPFYSQNSERRRLKLARLETIAISAIKQSKTLFLPKIQEPLKYSNLLKEVEAKQRFIAYVPEKATDVKTAFPKLDGKKDTVVLIGPEGGFTQEEYQRSISKDFIPLSLGEKRLRTETAAVFTASAYQLLCP